MKFFKYLKSEIFSNEFFIVNIINLFVILLIMMDYEIDIIMGLTALLILNSVFLFYFILCQVNNFVYAKKSLKLLNRFLDQINASTEYIDISNTDQNTRKYLFVRELAEVIRDLGICIEYDYAIYIAKGYKYNQQTDSWIEDYWIEFFNSSSDNLDNPIIYDGKFIDIFSKEQKYYITEKYIDPIVGNGFYNLKYTGNIICCSLYEEKILHIDQSIIKE